MSHDTEQNTTLPSPSRRTVLAGAAWTVPVIAAASVAPTASASGVTALAFDRSTYNGTACGTITGAYVTVTANGVAAAGQSVTTTLSGGYTFASGSTTSTLVSGADGRVNLPAINVPAAGGSASLTATSGSSTASAAVTGVSNAKAKIFATGNSSPTVQTNVPAGSKPVGWATFLAPNGDLYYLNKIFDRNVDTAIVDHENNSNQDFFTYTTTTGSAKTFVTGHDSPTVQTNVPAGSKAVGWATFLAPNGDLYYLNKIFDNNVATAIVDHENNPNQDFFAYTQYTGC